MNIIKETNRRVVKMMGYQGVCDGCGTPITYDDELLVIEVPDMENDERVVVVPIDILVCPSCRHTIQAIRIWKNLEITSELEGIKA